MIKRVLVTGGLGFIGRRLVDRLCAAGWITTVVDNLARQVHGAAPIARINADVIVGDVRDKRLITEVVPRQDAIIHLAAETGTGQSMYEVERYVDVNVRGTACLMEAVLTHGRSVKRIILASSRAVYGEGRYCCSEHGIFYPDSRAEQDLASGRFEINCPICGKAAQSEPTDEAAKVKPASVYAVTKHSQEELLLSLTKAVAIPAVVLRLQNVFGPGQSLNNPYTGILSIFSNLLRQDRPIDIFEDGLESRDFVFVEDVVDVFKAALDVDLHTNEVLNVGSGEARTVIDIARILKAKLDSKSPINITGAYRKGDIRHNRADITALKERLHVAPRHSFEEGLSKFVDWVQTQPHFNAEGYENSLAEMREKGLLK